MIKEILSAREIVPGITEGSARIVARLNKVTG